MTDTTKTTKTKESIAHDAAKKLLHNRWEAFCDDDPENMDKLNSAIILSAINEALNVET